MTEQQPFASNQLSEQGISSSHTNDRRKNTVSWVSAFFLVLAYIVGVMNLVIVGLICAAVAFALSIVGIRKSRKSCKIISIVVLILSVISLGTSFYIGVNFVKLTGRNPFFGFTPIDLKQETVYATAAGRISDWSTYIHPFYGYTLRYPVGWEVSYHTTQDGFGQSQVQFIEPSLRCVTSVSFQPDDRPDPTKPLDLSALDVGTLEQLRGAGGTAEHMSISGTQGIASTYMNDTNGDIYTVAKNEKIAFIIAFGSPELCKRMTREMVSTFNF